MKTILVPIDFSADSINALEHAILIANKIDASVRLIHVVKSKNFEPPFVINEFTSTMSNSIDDFMKRIIDKYANKVKAGMDFKIREGKIYREICNQAKYDDAYLIIMGTHGVSGFEEKVIGSNAYRVVVNSPCPIITIRQKFNPVEPKKIILPIDMSKETRKKIPFVTEYALNFNSEIHVLGVSDTNSVDIKKKLTLYCNQVEDYLSEKKLNVHKEIIMNNDITNSIIQYALKNDAQLITIMTEQLNRLAFWLGPTAQEIVNNSPIPVMSFSSLIF
ncbi:MAG: universal stress protein [Bacteroidales bacterium]|nr:universal stress protein [Bacteroidales bacterium]